jgi:hypothetical protein
MAPLRENLRLQENVVNSQMFVCFIDHQSESYMQKAPQR